MKNRHLLKKVIWKACDNGYTLDPTIADFIIILDSLEDSSQLEHFIIHRKHYGVIFSHDFAKAFFGKIDEWDSTECDCGGVDTAKSIHLKTCAKLKAKRCYKFHLKQMVLEKYPLLYLKEFLK